MAEAPAQDAKTANPEIQKLQEEKQKAELGRDIAKARAEAVKAGLPTPETKALEGTISVDEKFALPSQIFTYNAVTEIAKQAGSDIRKTAPNTETLVVYSEKELGAVGAYKSALTQIAAFQSRYNALLLPEAAVAAAPAAALLAPELLATFIKSVADVVALFRTNVEIKATTVTVDDVAVIAELARWLRESKSTIKVIYPSIHLPRQFFTDGVTSSELIKQLGALSNNRNQAGEMIAAFEAKSPDEQKEDQNKDKMPRLKSLNEQVDKFTSALAAVDEKTGLNTLTLLLKAEQLQPHLAKENTAIVYIKTNATGGSNKTTRNLFTGNKLFHTGGSVITFMLFDKDGAILFSKTYWCATEFTKFKKKSVPEVLKNF